MKNRIYRTTFITIYINLDNICDAEISCRDPDEPHVKLFVTDNEFYGIAQDEFEIAVEKYKDGGDILIADELLISQNDDIVMFDNIPINKNKFDDFLTDISYSFYMIDTEVNVKKYERPKFN